MNFTARRGSVSSIIGASGSGKSTLLRCMNLLETPQAGKLVIAGEELEFTGHSHRIDTRKTHGCAARSPWCSSSSHSGLI
ncbi:ATP-binding cassette domain-containing protein [Paracoccus alkanivorans]|uniref:ATP-binding cassette domain-containing protein n=1 Tax=Paracoccus alkanivorans TaxID=2116655 RepID=UPI003C79E32C